MTEQYAETLTAEDREDFKRLDGAVAKGLATVFEVGNALREIRARRLYREEYPTFQEYVQRKHELSRAYADRLVLCAEVMNQLKNDANWRENSSILPRTESQTRELVPVPAERRGDAWALIVKDAAERHVPVTAAFIRERVAPYRVTRAAAEREWQKRECEGEEEVQRRSKFDIAIAEFKKKAHDYIDSFPPSYQKIAAQVLHELAVNFGYECHGEPGR